MSEETKNVKERMKEITNEINLRIYPNDHLIEMIEGHIVGAMDQARREERRDINKIGWAAIKDWVRRKHEGEKEGDDDGSE